MVSLELTEAEFKVLHTLVSAQLGRFNLLKDYYNIRVTRNVKELNSLSKKLTAIQQTKKK